MYDIYPLILSWCKMNCHANPELSLSNMCNLNFMQLGNADPNSC